MSLKALLSRIERLEGKAHEPRELEPTDEEVAALSILRHELRPDADTRESLAAEITEDEWAHIERRMPEVLAGMRPGP